MYVSDVRVFCLNLSQQLQILKLLDFIGSADTTYIITLSYNIAAGLPSISSFFFQVQMSISREIP